MAKSLSFDGEIIELTKGYKLDRYKIHDIEVVVDRLVVPENFKASFKSKNDNEDTTDKELERVRQTVNTALRIGKGSLMIQLHTAETTDTKTKKKKGTENANENIRHYSRHLMCPTSGISYPEAEPNLFSFNSPYGACPNCNGLGEVAEVDLNKIIPDPKKTIKKGGIAPLGEAKNNWTFSLVESVLKKYGYDLNTAVEDIESDVINVLLYGSDEMYEAKSSTGYTHRARFEGIISFIEKQLEDDTVGPGVKRWADSFMNKNECPKCHGARLKKEALYFKIGGKNIHELASSGLNELIKWFEGAEHKMTQRQAAIATEPLKEIRSRLRFLVDVGLDYLTLNRSARTLSGGEAQRIRLATQIGSQLVGVLYILDEPSIGLHQRDNHRLIGSLKALRDGGNSVLVVEHDRDMMLESDHLIDIGPGAGVHGGRIIAQGGGRIIAQGDPKKLLKGESITAQYLRGDVSIEVPKQRRKGSNKFLTLEGATDSSRWKVQQVTIFKMLRSKFHLGNLFVLLV